MPEEPVTVGGGPDVSRQKWLEAANEVLQIYDKILALAGTKWGGLNGNFKSPMNPVACAAGGGGCSAPTGGETYSVKEMYNNFYTLISNDRQPLAARVKFDKGPATIYDYNFVTNILGSAKSLLVDGNSGGLSSEASLLRFLQQFQYVPKPIKPQPQRNSFPRPRPNPRPNRRPTPRLRNRK